jgi:hypothetical protein
MNKKCVPNKGMKEISGSNDKILEEIRVVHLTDGIEY